MRVATFSQSSTILQSALETQAKLASNQEQQVSGTISSDYAGLGTDAATLVDLEVSLSRSEASLSVAEDALSRVEMTYSALGGISDILTSMRADVTAVLTDEDLTALQVVAEAYLEDVSSLLNTQLAGRYLFAGSNTQEAPVDLTAYEATDLTTTDSSYYTGDTYVQTVRLSSERSLDYGITADTEAIETAMRALSYAASADPLTTDDVEVLSDLLVEAQDGVIALQSITSTAASSLESFISSEEEYIAEAEALASELNSSDVAELIVQASSYEVQLEASYAALGSLSDLSVLDYLF
ncbi:flagellin [Roseibium polysiphoniae]|uniref:Flagellin n=1 Tax=Roseibium polysiphoniae TaxID=2571221 RepID=A0ABR9CB88_9HYPH|nr:flagellin [Roseibium polysiphoniae]MBD8877158.1 flagellin [Roseibium polysiphoniae]